MELLDENEDVIRVFMVTRSHCIIVGEKIVDIDIRAVKCAMDIYGVVNQKDCYERVRKLFQTLLSETESG